MPLARKTSPRLLFGNAVAVAAVRMEKLVVLSDKTGWLTALALTLSSERAERTGYPKSLPAI